jgi:CRP-like cAMP-binding protein
MLLEYLKKHLNLSEELGEKFDTTFRHEYVNKGDILFRPESFSQRIIFIEKGLIRTYYLKDGKDITYLFLSENSFLAPVECVFYNKPAPYGWEALENCEIRIAQYRDFESFFSQVPGMEKFVRMLLINVLHTVAEKLYSIQFQTAQDRYKNLIETYPDILLRAPLGHIASYLGITQQTLSVIRSGK